MNLYIKIKLLIIYLFIKLFENIKFRNSFLKHKEEYNYLLINLIYNNVIIRK